MRSPKDAASDTQSPACAHATESATGRRETQPKSRVSQERVCVSSLRRLEDLHAHLAGVFSRLRRLQRLDLYGNPLAEETDYRLHVIKALPWLQVLDCQRVSAEERARAAKVTRASFEMAPSSARAVREARVVSDPFFFLFREAEDLERNSEFFFALSRARARERERERERERATSRNTYPPSPLRGPWRKALTPFSVDRQASGEDSSLSGESGGRVHLAESSTPGRSDAASRSRARVDAAASRAVADIARVVLEKRILLRPHWMDHDRQRCGFVSQPQFQAVLERYGLWPASSDKAECLVERYAFADTQQRRRSTGNHTQSSAPIRSLRHEACVEYVRFCADVEPRATRGRGVPSWAVSIRVLKVFGYVSRVVSSIYPMCTFESVVWFELKPTRQRERARALSRERDRPRLGTQSLHLCVQIHIGIRTFSKR